MGLGGLPFNVMLTGYSLFERDSEAQKLDREFLRKWNWSHMVLDEVRRRKREIEESPSTVASCFLSVPSISNSELRNHSSSL